MDRNFKVLIVEDESDFSDTLIQIIKDISDSIEITCVESRDEAQLILSDEKTFFDLVSLDLRLPAKKEDVERLPEHGMAVLGFCREYSPGTPVLILTGSNTEEMVSVFLNQSENIDVWAEGIKRQTIDHLPKANMDEFPERFTPIFSAVTALFDIELSLPKDYVLPIKHDRLMRIFVKDRGGVRAVVTTNDTGLSDAKVYFVKIIGKGGNLLDSSVAKCGCVTDITSDSDNYERMITRLRAGVAPHKLKVLSFGAKDISGVFYGLAHGCDSSFFKAAIGGELTQESREYIQRMTDLWVNASIEKRCHISEVRRSLTTDDKADELIYEYGLTWANEFESQAIQIKEGCIHGDLHGENILVDVSEDSATLIDFGDVSDGSCVLDPITLECSFLFHPDGLHDSKWPTEEQVNNWSDIDKYVEGSPVENEIRFCREWSDSVKAGNRELAACLYSYALRQLKYPNTNKKFALALLHSAKELFSDS